MSVSAHPTPQPGTEKYHPVFVGKTLEQLGEILTRYPTKQAALLPALWLLEDGGGCNFEQHRPGDVDGLGLTPAQVEGRVLLYSLHYLAPAREDLVHDSHTSA